MFLTLINVWCVYVHSIPMNWNLNLISYLGFLELVLRLDDVVPQLTDILSQHILALLLIHYNLGHTQKKTIRSPPDFL